jgi:transcriptional regulator with XRE-family HTH domain
MEPQVAIGGLLREWRQRRRLSQLELALGADISTKHLSFIETGRAQPSREMVLNLAERLEIPLRERNRLLVAAGFAPVFPNRDLTDPALNPARQAIDLVLTGHEPFPALVVDRHWTLVASNRMVAPLLSEVDPALLVPPINVLRLSLHPGGLAPRTANLQQWRQHLLDRLRHQVELTADPVLADLLVELRSAAGVESSRRPPAAAGFAGASIAIPFQLMTNNGILSFISTTTVFGTPIDITLSELALEAFYPADTATAETLRKMAAGEYRPAAALPSR